jgi:hypothetical protein
LSEEQRTYLPRKPAKLTIIRDLSPDTKSLVRIMCFVIESQPGLALVQDIYDNVENATKIKVFVEGALEVDTKYMLIGKVTEKSNKSGTELVFNAELVYNIDSLDVLLFKQTLDLEGAVLQTLDQ